MKTFQQRLKLAMNNADTNPAALARDCNVSRQAVLGWLEDSQPRAETFMLACRHLGVNPTWLALGEGAMSAYGQDSTGLSSDAVEHARCYMILPDHIRHHIQQLTHDYAITLLGSSAAVRKHARQNGLTEVQ